MDTPAFSVQALPAAAIGGPYGAPGRRGAVRDGSAPGRRSIPPHRPGGGPGCTSGPRPSPATTISPCRGGGHAPSPLAFLVGGVGKGLLVAFLVPGAAASVPTSTTATWSDEPADGR
ncbi:hypothetical protein [Streptomyces sp. NPDC048295]|uniref:hypothetical protein n=1 Tax=Streptomyces sp. NPDC048295 TaxID=3154617 RepID=UPI00341A5414